MQQGIQVLPLDVIHEHIDPFEFFIGKRLVDMGQSPVIESLEHLRFKNEVIVVSPARINHLFERKYMFLNVPVSDQVDSTKPTSTKQSFYDIAASSRMWYGGPNREYRLFLQHAAPHKREKLLPRSEEHTSELQSHLNLVCRLLLEK